MELRQFLGGPFHFLAQGFILFRLLFKGPLQINDFLAQPFLFCRHGLHGSFRRQRIIPQGCQLFVIFLLLRRFLGIIMRQTGQLAPLIFLVEAIVNPRLFRMTGQRFKLIFNLVDDILHTHEVVFRVRELSDRLALTVAVLRNPRRFLKEGPAVFGAAV